MKRVKTIVMLTVIATLIVALIMQAKRHEQEMVEFRKSVRNITVAARATDSITGDYLMCQLGFHNSGEDLWHSSSSCSDRGQQTTWITTKPKHFYVTSPGYSTQSFVVASSWTNIHAKLDKLETASNK